MLIIAVTCATCQGVEETEEIWNFWNFVIWATEHSLLPHNLPLGMVSNIVRPFTSTSDTMPCMDLLFVQLWPIIIVACNDVFC